jgi:hypothetical protein
VLRLARHYRAAARPLVSVARSGTLGSPGAREERAAQPRSASPDRNLGVR